MYISCGQSRLGIHINGLTSHFEDETWSPMQVFGRRLSGSSSSACRRTSVFPILPEVKSELFDIGTLCWNSLCWECVKEGEKRKRRDIYRLVFKYHLRFSLSPFNRTSYMFAYSFFLMLQ